MLMDCIGVRVCVRACVQSVLSLRTCRILSPTSIKQNVCLQEFGVQMQKHNVQPSSLTEYQDLWSIVAPEDKPLEKAFHENK